MARAIRIVIGALPILAATALLDQKTAWAQQDTGELGLARFQASRGTVPGALGETFRPGARDANGNRVLVIGEEVLAGSTLGPGLGLAGQSRAVGNELNVLVEGSFNTVIVDAVQINNGDQTAQTVLNGGIDLDD
ncbi:MAG: holdfast attachment protein HfaA [Maricaulaceae bacterium]